MTIEHSLLSHFKMLFKKSIQNQNMLLLIQFCLDFFPPTVYTGHYVRESKFLAITLSLEIKIWV